MTFPFITEATLPVIAFGAVCTIAVLLIWMVILEVRLRRFMTGKNGSSLEHILADIVAANKATREYHAKSDALFSQLDKRLTHAARGLATVRFNALSGDTSGRQSFATAILSERGDGVVISSMHSRDNTRVYAKPVMSFASEHDLTDEELAAIGVARDKCGVLV